MLGILVILANVYWAYRQTYTGYTGLVYWLYWHTLAICATLYWVYWQMYTGYTGRYILAILADVYWGTPAVTTFRFANGAGEAGSITIRIMLRACWRSRDLRALCTYLSRYGRGLDFMHRFRFLVWFPLALYVSFPTKNLQFLPYYTLYGGSILYQINENPRWSQNPTYTPVFTHHVRSWLLVYVCSPAIAHVINNPVTNGAGASPMYLSSDMAQNLRDVCILWFSKNGLCISGHGGAFFRHFFHVL